MEKFLISTAIYLQKSEKNNKITLTFHGLSIETRKQIKY